MHETVDLGGGTGAEKEGIRPSFQAGKRRKVAFCTCFIIKISENAKKIKIFSKRG